MTEVFAYGLIALMGVFVMPKWSFMPYDVPRQTLVSVGAYILLLLAVHNTPDLVAGYAVMLSPMLGAWVVACLMSPRPDMAFERAIQFFSCLVVGILAGQDPGNRAGAILIAGAGTTAAIYAIVQWHFRITLMKQIESVVNTDEACHFTRNVNFAGPWLVLTLLFTLRLIEGQELGAGILIGAAAAVQAYAVWCTKCRTAYLGIGAAFCYFGLTAATGYIIALGAILFGLIIMGAVRGKAYKLFRTKSLRERWAFVQIFWHAIKRRPLFGYGFDVVKTRVPQFTREINERTKGRFLDPDNYETPVVRKAHNDLMQHVCDVGLAGLALGIGTLAGGISRPDPFYMGILVVILAMGITFHQMYWLPTQCLFWLAWGSMTQPWPSMKVFPGALELFLVVLGLGILQTVIRTQAADVCHWLGNWAQADRQKWFARATAFRPASLSLLQGANELARLKRPKEAAEWLHKCVERYDGDTRMWVIASCLGELYLATGSLRLARIYHEEALAYWPGWTFARRKIAWIDKVEKKEGL